MQPSAHLIDSSLHILQSMTFMLRIFVLKSHAIILNRKFYSPVIPNQTHTPFLGLSMAHTIPHGLSRDIEQVQRLFLSETLYSFRLNCHLKFGRGGQIQGMNKGSEFCGEIPNIH